MQFSARPPGPIARKLLASMRKASKQKVVDLAAWREGRAEADRIAQDRPADADRAASPPAFARYVVVNNWVIGTIELLQEERALRRFVERIERGEDKYMPKGPPISPLTRSFFWQWMLYDVAVGVERETVGTVLLALARSYATDPGFVGALEKLVDSRLGLHIHEGVRDGRILLRELVTDGQRACICPAGYAGKRGDLWLARVLPPPTEEFDEHVVVMTPYVILGPAVRAWQAYLDRTLPKVDAQDRREAYAHLMKFGLDERYWPEYVFEAYARHRKEAVFLVGLPDVPESRPHSRANAEREVLPLP